MFNLKKETFRIINSKKPVENTSSPLHINNASIEYKNKDKINSKDMLKDMLKNIPKKFA